MLAKGPGVNMSIDIKGTGGDQSNNATQRDIFSIFLLFSDKQKITFFMVSVNEHALL